MPRAASEDWGSANCRCVTPGDPPAPGRRPTHQPSHHTRTARWPAGTLRPAAPASPCPFRIMAPQDPYDRAAPATRSPSAPPPTLARAHAGLTRLSRPIECATPGPAPGRAPPLRPTRGANGLCRRPSPSRVRPRGVSRRNPSRSRRPEEQASTASTRARSAPTP